jgi:hypothetical protein
LQEKNKSKLTPNRNGKHQQENAKGTQQSREITLGKYDGLKTKKCRRSFCASPSWQPRLRLGLQSLGLARKDTLPLLMI